MAAAMKRVRHFMFITCLLDNIVTLSSSLLLTDSTRLLFVYPVPPCLTWLTLRSLNVSVWNVSLISTAGEEALDDWTDSTQEGRSVFLFVYLHVFINICNTQVLTHKNCKILKIEVCKFYWVGSLGSVLFGCLPDDFTKPSLMRISLHFASCFTGKI